MDKKHQKLLKLLRANEISGAEFGRAHSGLMDAHIKTLTKDFPAEIAIIATGGYGRAELCPYSDIDLLFLVPKKAPASLEKQIEKFLYKIWDSGIKIGHAVRTVAECLTVTATDIKAQTTLLDARLISGDKDLFEDLITSLEKHRKTRNKKTFVKAKLEERDTRHLRFNDSRYVLEPNIKDGKGSLRDYQTLFWITHVTYNAPTPKDLQDAKILTKKERLRFEKAHDFLLTVRCHLHDIADRPEERLHFDIQPQIAQRLDYSHRNNAHAVERFMKHYFHYTRDIGDLTRIIIAAIEQEEEQRAKLIRDRSKSYLGFEIIGNRLSFNESQPLKDHPVDMLRFFRVAQESDLDIHPSALQKITRNLSLIDAGLRNNKLANNIFLEILTDSKNAAIILRRMNEAGVLERFIPEFRRIIALMQFDRYHVFTVDEHTLHAIDILHKIESGALKSQAPLASVLIHDIKHHRALFVAMLLHDICKGREKKQKGQDHSTLGAELALKLCPRLGLTDYETRLVSWLIFDHLFMAEMAFKRDLEDPKTVDDFLFRIHDTERLKMLTILTTADIMAVGPDRWTNWKDKLLTELYTLADNKLTGKSTDIPTLTITPPKDWDTKTPRIDIEQDEDKNATTIGIYTKDRTNLFTTLTGALAAAGTSIIEARIQTLEDGNIADIFTVQNLSGQPIIKKHRHKEIKTIILSALEGTLDIKQTLKKRTKKPTQKDMVFDVPDTVRINNKASADFTVLEINSRDRHGLLYDIALIFARHKLDIKSAKINTYGLKATDVFYVTDEKGKKLGTAKKLKEDLESCLSSSS